MTLERVIAALLGSGPNVDAVSAAAVVLAALVGLRLAALALLGLLLRAPGRLGRDAHRLALVLRPRLARRLAAATLGLALPSAALAAPASASTLTASAADAQPSRTPASPPTPRAPAPAPAPAFSSQPHATYVVGRGDTLWDIAKAHLPRGATDAQIARAWPRWYSANARVIGSDPSLLHPGMRLRNPGRRSTGTSTSQHQRPSPHAPVSSAWAQSLDPDRR